MTLLWRSLIHRLDDPVFLRLLFVVNLLGSIYGFYWYKNQLAMTEPAYLWFVPDSPTASAAFTLVLLLYIWGKRSPLLEAFAAVTLFKYGIWAVAMIVAGAAMSAGSFFHALHWTDWMLMISHLGMALEGVLYVRLYTFDWRHLTVVGLWTLWNDWMDYGVGVHPWLPSTLAGQEGIVAVFTIGLSWISLGLFGLLICIRPRMLH
ncbi:hypothetical protein GCM10011571_11070 [Marinithermofilum abyssi]|uniref:DUF1405 domain-containing protein n=1 Tax=Marinithermofilum abyssi TaxID=1571185 RepID=A0A8J2VCN3_9BACL|nr:DUF1405 domain-containing protein [Marinithermofilum abyssi]GGE11498.1 hypothetical protein GCM10011571_11070 [Marinithermofilum abyssi]